MTALPDQHYPQSSGGTRNDGKVNPTRYSSVKEKDLGLCYETFFSDKGCRHQVRCRWRHAPLTYSERRWMSRLGAEGVADLMEYAWEMPLRPYKSFWDRGLQRLAYA